MKTLTSGVTIEDNGKWVEGTKSPNPHGRPPKTAEQKAQDAQRRFAQVLCEDSFVEDVVRDAKENVRKKGRGWRSDLRWLSDHGIPLAPRYVDLGVHNSDVLPDLSDDQISTLLDGDPVVIEESSENADTSGLIPASTSGA